MSNYLNNRVSAKLNPKQVVDAKSHLEAFKNMLPFLIGLTPSERMKMTKIRRDNKLFVEDTIRALEEFPQILPSYVDKAELELDYDLFNTLDGIEEILMQLLQRVRDTRMMAGSEAILASLMAYRLFKMAAAAGVPGAQTASERMGIRFEGIGNSSSSDDEESDESKDSPENDSPE